MKPTKYHYHVLMIKDLFQIIYFYTLAYFDKDLKNQKGVLKDSHK